MTGRSTRQDKVKPDANASTELGAGARVSSDTAHAASVANGALSSTSIAAAGGRAAPSEGGSV